MGGKAAEKGRTDLTEGPIFKKLLAFTVPILMGSIVTQLYNVADSVVVGRFRGTEALAAVSAATPVMSIINLFLIGLSSGSNVTIAMHAGKSVVPMITAQFGAFSRIPLAYFLAVRTGSCRGIFYALLIAAFLRCAAILVCYYGGGWKRAVAGARRDYLRKHPGRRPMSDSEISSDFPDNNRKRVLTKENAFAKLHKRA